MMKEKEIEYLYKQRFSPKERRKKDRIWEIVCKQVLCKYIPEGSSVMDVGAGYCEFINHIKAKEKIAVDKNLETRQYARNDVKILNVDCKRMTPIESDSVDVIFSSNFLEHLSDKDEVFKTLKEFRRVLKKDGRLILMGPNIRYLAGAYWDFFDHKVPLSHLSLTEVLGSLEFTVLKVCDKFLPYTTKSKIPQWGFLIKLYLSFPLFYKIFGKQFLIIVQK